MQKHFHVKYNDHQENQLMIIPRIIKQSHHKMTASKMSTEESEEVSSDHCIIVETCRYGRM
jgi:hypothetical protein